MKDIIKNKKVLFITTKNIDYIRNLQEIKIIKENAKEYKVIGSNKRSYLKRLVKVYFEILFTSFKKYDSVFIGFAPQLIVPFWKIKMRNKEIIIDFFISLYDTIVFDRKKLSKNSIVAKILFIIDKKTINYADRVICDTKAHGRYFVEEFDLDKSKLEVLYLSADKSIYYNRNIRRPKSLDNKFVVLYFGSILPLQGIDIVLEALNILKDKEWIHFYMIGPIDGKYNKPISSNITYINWLSQEDLAKYISYSDLCLAGHFNDRIEKAKRTIPGKAYIYEAMDKPMILGDNSATHELYSESDNKIYFVKMGNPEILASTVLKIGGKFNEINNSNTML